MALVESKLKELGLTLPEAPSPVGAYCPFLISGCILYLSGVLPRQGKEVQYQGKVGTNLSIRDGIAAARLCALSGLSVVKKALGDLDRVKRVLRLVGYIHADEFTEHAAVMNGASELFLSLFGERGRHVRTSVGVSSLPLNAACEIELTLEIE